MAQAQARWEFGRVNGRGLREDWRGWSSYQWLLSGSALTELQAEPLPGPFTAAL